MELIQSPQKAMAASQQHQRKAELFVVSGLEMVLVESMTSVVIVMMDPGLKEKDCALVQLIGGCCESPLPPEHAGRQERR